MLSDIWQLSIKVSSWTSSIADISMSDNSRYDDTSYEWMFVMIDMTMDFTIRIDTISNTDSSGKIFESSDLRFGRFMKFKITDEWYTDRGTIIVSGMCSYDVFTTSSSFVDITKWVDNKIISYITSSIRHSMKTEDVIEVGTSLLHGSDFTSILCSVVDNDMSFISFITICSFESLIIYCPYDTIE